MIFNYIKIAFRNIVRHKVYSIINILGLAIGMACAILLLLFVRDELSYDRHNSKYKRIYMVETHSKIGGKEDHSSYTPLPLAQALKDEYPGIEECIRITPARKINFIDQNGETIGEENICYADPGIFKILDHKFIYGSPEGALESPNTIVLSETLAKKYFGEQDPVGKTFSRKDGTAYIVKGVFEDLPRNSSNSYAALITSKNLSECFGAEQYAMISKTFTLIVTKTYTLLAENAQLSYITGDYKRFSDKYIPSFAMDDEFRFVFKPLADIYLHSYPWQNSPVNMLQRVYIISALALFILAIACINYMNLSTARATGRAREVGVRKVLGANRVSLIRQFLCESIIITFMAMLIALVFIELAIPSFNNLIGKQLSFSATGKVGFFSGLLIVTIFVGLFAGSYPAFVLSSFLPVKVFRGFSRSGAGKGMLRKMLVVIQYSLSVIMIVCTILLMKQMSYIRNMDLGYNMQNIFIVRPPNNAQQGSMNAFKQDLLKYSGISSVTLSNITPGTGYMRTICRIEDSRGDLAQKHVAFLSVDYDYIGLMEMMLLEGRSFNAETESDRAQAIMVNEALVKEMGWAGSPIGKRIALAPGLNTFGPHLKVIGVLKDFHFRSLRDKIEPTIITLLDQDWPSNIVIVSIKINPTNTEKTIEFIKDKWLEINPNDPLNLLSLEDLINREYRIDEAASRIFLYSALLGIFVSCLGLFGLSSYTTENRTKEIGVRKVFGASVGSIVSKLSLSFLTLVIIASIIACPIAYYAMSKWLENFAYNTEMSWWVFVGAACIAMAIALATVSYHAVKAALTDPVKALRYE